MKLWRTQNIAIAILMILVVVLFAYIKTSEVEGFTPKIRQLYRPHIRNIRVKSTEYYAKMRQKIQNFIRRAGLI